MTKSELTRLLGHVVPPLKTYIKQSSADVVGQLSATVSALEARIIELEARPIMKFVGVYADSRRYEVGNVTTHQGSAWHCNQATMLRPGTPEASAVWTLLVKRGRDAR